MMLPTVSGRNPALLGMHSLTQFDMLDQLAIDQWRSKSLKNAKNVLKWDEIR